MISFFGSFQVDIGPVVVASPCSGPLSLASLPSDRAQVKVSLRSNDASFTLMGGGIGDRDGAVAAAVATASATRQLTVAASTSESHHQSAATVLATPIDQVRVVPLVVVYDPQRESMQCDRDSSAHQRNADGVGAAKRELDTARNELLTALSEDDGNTSSTAVQKSGTPPSAPPPGVAETEQPASAVRVLPRSATAVISVEWCGTERNIADAQASGKRLELSATSVDVSLGDLGRVCTQDAQYTIQLPLAVGPPGGGSSADQQQQLLLYCTVTLRLVDLSDDVAVLVRATVDEEEDPTALRENEPREKPMLSCDALLQAAASRRHVVNGRGAAAPSHRPLKSAPYGCMPLFHLYEHFVHFYRVHLGRPVRAAASIRRCLGQTQNLKTPMLCDGSAVVGCGDVAYRWDVLDALDCSSCILGDTGFAPLAGVLRHLAGLRMLNLSQSQLGLVSAKRLVAALMGHPSLEELTLTGNNFFEYAGEELLRLCKASKVLQVLDLGGNVLSPRLVERFRTMSTFHAKAILNHPFRALSRSFDYISDRDSLPEDTCWRLVEPLWRMIAIVPPSPPPLVAADGDSSPVPSHGAPVLPVGIPLVAAAPLLSNLLRSVFLEMCTVCRDPYIRAVFAPAGLASASARQERTVGEPRMSFASPGGPTVGSGSEVLGAPIAPPFPSPVTLAPWDPEALYLHSYAKMLVTTLRTGLDAPARWDDAARVLRAIGAAHERRGVGPLLYCRANEFLVSAMESHFPEEDFNADAKAAMIQVLALMTRTAASGMQRTA